MTTKLNTTNNKIPIKEGRLAINTKFKKRWILVGLLLVLLGYVGFFFNNHLIYAGITEEITFQSEDIQLDGVLVRPATSGPHPAIVILHGAGHNKPYGKLSYRILTNVYVRQGFAVLSYNKRGTGGPVDDYQKVTFQDLISDGVAAVNLLRSQPDVIPDQVGLFGISESGWFTPEIAAKVGDIAFIVNKVGPPLPWTTTVLFETRNDALFAGVSEEDIKDVLTLQSRIFQFIINAAADESLANGPEREEINALLADMQKRPGVEEVLIKILPEYDPEIYAAMASKYSYDPYPFLKEIDIPMLYILGGKDINVPFDQSVTQLEELKLEHGKDITVKAYPEAGHYLYRWDAIPQEGFYVPGYLDLIGTWAAVQVTRP